MHQGTNLIDLPPPPTILTVSATTITMNVPQWATAFGNLEIPAQCWNLILHQLQLNITGSLQPPKNSSPCNPSIISSVASMTLPHEQNHFPYFYFHRPHITTNLSTLSTLWTLATKTATNCPL